MIAGRRLLRACGLVVGLALATCLGCRSQQAPGNSQPAERSAAATTIQLRFRPLDRLGHREHWIYDVQVPGAGIVRSAFSFDVLLLAKLDHESFAVRETIHQHQMFQDRVPVQLPSVLGTALTYQWGRDHALIGEITADAKDPGTAAAAKAAAQGARFGTLIEYPEQAVAVGDSWSIEPRRLVIAPGHEATLRPSYTLEAVEQRPEGAQAVISADVQVDLIPILLAQGVSIEGGGTAAGSLHVRVRDGVLLEARSVMHFSQETRLPTNESLGYREFSATAHVFTSKPDAEPKLQDEPYSIEALAEDRDCDLALSSAAQRLSTAPTRQHVYLQAVEQAVKLPELRGGRTLREAGWSLNVAADGKRVSLDALELDARALAQKLRAQTGTEHAVIYLYGDTQTPVSALRTLLGARPRAELRLVVRDPQAHPLPLKTTRWLEQQLREALAAKTEAERELRLAVALDAHMMLCEPAVAAFQQALMPGAVSWDELRGRIINSFVKCGCNATQLDGLESSLYAIFGSPDLRWLPLPASAIARALAGQTLEELAKLLAPAR